MPDQYLCKKKLPDENLTNSSHIKYPLIIAYWFAEDEN